MEDIQAYIESGRLEEYALGELSPAERADVEAWAARHPEVRAELDQVMVALDAYGAAHAMTPPAAMRDRVLGNVLAQISATQPTAAAPAPVGLTASHGGQIEQFDSASRKADAVPAVMAAPAARSNSWAWAASVALLLSLAGNWLLYSRWQQTSSDLVALQGDQTRLADNTKALQTSLGSLREENGILRDDQFRAVALAGTPAAPSARARVLFNAATHKVFLDVRNLPTLPTGKQYQLWALDNGKPVDAGMLASTTDGLLAMKDIASAQAFAVTVEPVGGSATPTMPIMAVGNV